MRLQPRRARVAVTAVVLVMLAATSIAQAAGPRGTANVGSVLATLTVSNREDFARVGEPVTSGVPLSVEDTVSSADELALVGPDGPVDAQLEVTARHGGSRTDESRPIRWLLADFAADVPARGSVTYELRRQSPPPVTNPVAVSEETSGITVNTGAAEFFLSRTRLGILDWVRPAGAPRRDLAGTPITAVDRRGNTYSSATASPDVLTVATRGPIHTVVRIEGPLRGTPGNLVDFTAWVHFTRGSARVKIDLRLENRRPPAYTETAHPDSWDIGSPNSVWIRDLSVRVAGPTDATAAAFGTQDGVTQADLRLPLLMYQDSSGNDAWNRYRSASHPRLQSYTTFRGYRLTRGAALLASGDHAPGWALVTGPDKSFGIAIRRFWQQFPKALRVDGQGAVEIGLLPAEFASDHNLRAGEYKTHELLLDFDPGTDPAAFAAAARALDRPLVAAASPDHYARTRAFGLTAPRGETTATDYEDANRRTLEPNPAYTNDWPPNGSMLERIDEYDFYGWQDFGDVPLDYEPSGEGAGQMNLKYNFDWGMWMQWARTGDRRWFDLADAGSRHIADTDILHAPEAAPHWANGGYYGHSYHDEPGNLNPNRNYGAPHPDLAFGVPGMFALYHMTGYEPAREAAIEIADNISYRFHNTFGGNGEGWALASDGVMNGNERPLANGLLILTEAYRETGDSKYLATARAIVAYARADSQPYINGPTGSRDDFVKPWTLNMYMASLGRYLDVLDDFGLPDTENGRASLVRYADFQLANTYRPLAGDRAAFPYQWQLDGTDTGPDVCDWLLLGADAMSYAHRRTGDARYLDAAARLFATGSADPCFPDDEPVYWFTKEAANNAVYGHVYLATAWDGSPWWGDRRPTSLEAQVSPSLVRYGGTVTVSGSLTATDGPVPERTAVAVWGRPAAGGAWTVRAPATWSGSAGTYEATVPGTANTVLQMRFAGDDTYAPAASNSAGIRVTAYLSRPWTAPRILRLGRAFSIYGYLAPRHGGTTRLYLYRLITRNWRGRTYRSWRLCSRASATNYAYGTMTRYRLAWRAPYRGRYLVRAYHSDTSHAPTWSPVRTFAVW